MRVYNLSDSHHALLNVMLRRQKVSRLMDLNDPFELMPINVKNKTLRRGLEATKKELNNTKGVICFSRSWSNPVLWSHYADKHRGICLGFDVDDTMLLPVTYVSKLHNFKINESGSLTNLEKSFATNLLTTKFIDWRYEDEVRVFVNLDHSATESGLYFVDFSSAINLREIILGPRCEVPIAKIRKIAAEFPHKVSVKKARLAFTSYSVVENQRFKEKA